MFITRPSSQTGKCHRCRKPASATSIRVGLQDDLVDSGGEVLRRAEPPAVHHGHGQARLGRLLDPRHGPDATTCTTSAASVPVRMRPAKFINVRPPPLISTARRIGWTLFSCMSRLDPTPPPRSSRTARPLPPASPSAMPWQALVLAPFPLLLSLPVGQLPYQGAPSGGSMLRLRPHPVGRYLPAGCGLQDDFGIVCRPRGPTRRLCQRRCSRTQREL